MDKKGRFTLISINTSPSNGVKKRKVPAGVLKEDYGLEGDAHGGPWYRQVSLLAEEDIDYMRTKGLVLDWGDFAENLTTRGVELHKLPLGTRIYIGETEMEVTQIGKECHHGCEIFRQVGECIMPKRGIFAKVIKGGEISPAMSCCYLLP